MSAHAPKHLTLGILGGGQLGRMAVHAAQRMGMEVVVLEPDAACPAAQTSPRHLMAAYDAAAALALLNQQCGAVTTEFENVPAQTLEHLAELGANLAPGASAVRIAQDRRLEKAFFLTLASETGVAPGPFAVLETGADVQQVSEALLPAILKTARMGYDGKGQITVSTRAQLADAWKQIGQVPCVLEQRLALEAECSVIVARSRTGQVVHLPLQRNTHRNGVLHRTEVFEDNLPKIAVKSAQAAAKLIAEKLQYIGVLCVEFFIVRGPDGGLALHVNEMAPRPHNSGHYSIEACSASQFELQVRAAMGLPLVQPRLLCPAVMVNLLGDVWFAPGAVQPQEPNWSEVLAIEGVHLHLYGKREARRGRKMGHITITAAEAANAQAKADAVERALGLA